MQSIIRLRLRENNKRTGAAATAPAPPHARGGDIKGILTAPPPTAALCPQPSPAASPAGVREVARVVGTGEGCLQMMLRY
ncbi:hypothetical protein EVAR_14379_1 [Eumeta japonica]|uniref:Uncharacterized protein n=1 Tax=Eumeta variegata TaxID=151549 RepID=A0A4C1TX50_EUMVA|nr:hypothetical protein EVAR_14379_1 [Eumeta japonica]